MLLNGGELGDTRGETRILAPGTVKLMTSNHLPAALLTGQFGIGQHIMRPGFGYGYNCAVVLRSAAGRSLGRQGHILLGWRRRHLVLGRPNQ